MGMEVIKQKPDSRVTLLAKEGVETDVRKYYHLDERMCQTIKMVRWFERKGDRVPHGL